MSTEHLVDGQVRVFDASRRNRNFRVLNRSGGSLFVKEGTRTLGSSSIAREAIAYSILEPQDGSRPQFPYAPRLVDYNSDADVLVLEFVDDAMDLRESHRTKNFEGLRSAATVGDALATLHHSIPLSTVLDLLGESEPGVLDVDKPGLALLSDFSSSSIDLIRMVQSSTEFVMQLENMRRDWRNETLVHHDIRMDNILTSSPFRLPGIVIVDWETASAGDPAWDVGAAIADYLGLWIQSIPVTGTQPPEQLLPLADSPLSAVQPAIAALWHAYVQRSEMSISMQPEFLLRVVRFCGLKLIQSAIEMVQSSAHWNLTAVTHLQVASNMMQRPMDASRTLLGMGVAA